MVVYHVLHKNINQQKTDLEEEEEEMFLELQISILEWFPKDHVTLKTGVMTLKIQLFCHRNELHLKNKFK